jgi:hypothetical protein
VGVYADNKIFHLTKRVTFMSKFAKLHSYVLCFFKKQVSTLTSQMYCGLHPQFRQAHYHS